ncbi:hypothetical protein NKH77_47715 [Streptomyces sp. M19]
MDAATATDVLLGALVFRLMSRHGSLAPTRCGSWWTTPCTACSPRRPTRRTRRRAAYGRRLVHAPHAHNGHAP